MSEGKDWLHPALVPYRCRRIVIQGKPTVDKDGHTHHQFVEYTDVYVSIGKTEFDILFEDRMLHVPIERLWEIEWERGSWWDLSIRLAIQTNQGFIQSLNRDDKISAGTESPGPESA